jgi:hypothetical protein
MNKRRKINRMIIENSKIFIKNLNMIANIADLNIKNNKKDINNRYKESRKNRRDSVNSSKEMKRKDSSFNTLLRNSI